MTFKQVAGKIHLWLGLTSGLVVVIIGITGCLYVFIDEIKPIVYADRLYTEVPAKTTALPFSELKDNAQKALGSQYPIQSAEIPSEQEGNLIFRTRKFNEKAFLYSDYVTYYYRVYVNPYSGQVVHIENTKWEFFNLIVNIHISLLLGPVIGKQMIAWSVVIFVITLITGLILWWPKNKKSTKKRLWFQWKETTKWKRKNYDLHNITGFYVFIILLMIALTGLVWAFKGFDHTVQWIANGGNATEKPKPVTSDTSSTRVNYSLDNLIVKVHQQFPESSCFVSLPQNPQGTVSLFMDDGNAQHDISFKYDQYTGKLLETSSFSNKNNGSQLRALNYDIHTGAVLGLAGKIMAFIASLIAASLPITGFVIWWARGKKGKEKEKKKEKKEMT